MYLQGLHLQVDSLLVVVMHSDAAYTFGMSCCTGAISNPIHRQTTQEMHISKMAAWIVCKCVWLKDPCWLTKQNTDHCIFSALRSCCV